MGADLYIDLVFKPNYETWEEKFKEAVIQRDACEPGTPEHKHWRGKICDSLDLMYSEGYFRDSYSQWNLLRQFDLSWWGDVLPMVDKQGDLSVDNIRRFLEMLRKQQDAFEENLTRYPDDEQYDYHQRYAELQKFLNRAIELESPVNCSL